MSAARNWFGMKSKRRQGRKNTTRQPFRRARMETLEPRQVLSVTLASIGDVTLLAGAPLHIPLDGFDSDGGQLQFSVQSSNPAVTTFIPQGNRSMKISVADYGDMVFELFEGRVPRITERITLLAENGFYDGLIFHRVIDNFMIQGGAFTAGDSSQQVFSGMFDVDDQFHVDLQHTSSGLLSMAKSSEDTNSSQFFITEKDTRYLDFNHSVFGLLIEGDGVREAISNVDTDNSDKPDTDVVIESVEIYFDNQNATLMLKAADGVTGETDITITIIDSNGTEHVQPPFHVTVAADTENTQPFLADVPTVVTSIDTETSFQLTSFDIDGEPTAIGNGGVPFIVPTKYLDQFGVYDLYQNGVLGQNGYREVRVVANTDLAYSVDYDSGAVTVTPSGGLVGVHPILVAVAAWESEQIKYSGMDTQLVPIVIQPDGLDPVTELEMSIVQTPTATDEFGEIDQLPENVDWMDEWESFSVEIWASTTTATGPTDEFGIHTATFDLTYNTDYYTATKIEYGNMFSQDRTGTINDAAGLVENIGGRTPMYAVTPPLQNNGLSFDPENIEKFGDDKRVLVARVNFQPNATGGGVPLNADGGYMTPVQDLGLSIENAAVGWNVAEITTVQVAAAPSVDVWPVMYDNDDDGTVGLGDLAHFASAYRTSVGQAPNDLAWQMDYNRSGFVDLGDLAFFASNYRNSVGDATAYPAGFPEEWLTSTTPATSQTMAMVASTLADDSTAETQLAYAIIQAQSQKDSPADSRSTDKTATIVDLLMRAEEF